MKSRLTWKNPILAASGPDPWNRFNFWAPEVLQHEGRYWLYYTAKPTIGRHGLFKSTLHSAVWKARTDQTNSPLVLHNSASGKH